MKYLTIKDLKDRLSNIPDDYGVFIRENEAVWDSKAKWAGVQKYDIKRNNKKFIIIGG